MLLIVSCPLLSSFYVGGQYFMIHDSLFNTACGILRVMLPETTHKINKIGAVGISKH